MSHQNPAAYRPDIDGLRALSIILVVMFHLRVGFTRGGYIGVDVFFVISGFLITGLIAKEAQTSGFSFARFYERRIRRLFPALFAAFLATTFVSWWVLFPVELESYGRQLASAIGFAANLFFYAGAGYFADDSAMQPLHHTWSLAVEEQFYLFFPVLLLPLLRLRGRTLVSVLWFLAILSFGLSVYWMRQDNQEAAFYLLPARAWELLLGALVALNGVPALPNRHWRNGVSVLGVVAIIAAAGAFNKNVAFPGWSALVPCFAAALIIHTGRERDTWVYRAFSMRGIVLIGLASYSIYVWHQPIIVLWKSRFDIYLSVSDRLILGALSLAIGFASWRFIERPFRYGTLLPTRRAAFWGAGAAMASGLAIAGVLVAAQGFESRFPEEARRLATWKYVGPETDFSKARCFIGRAQAAYPRVDDLCVEIKPGKKNFLLIGDSHAGHWITAWREASPDQANLMLASASGCKPILHDPAGAPRCRAVMEWAFREFLPKNRLDGIIISANWVMSDVARVPETVRFLKQYADKIYVAGPVPIYFDTVPRLLLRSLLFKDEGLIDRRRDPARFPLDKALAEALRNEPVTYLSMIDTLCEERSCLVRTPDGEPMHFDYGHVTHKGGLEVARRLRLRNAFPLD